MLKLEFYPTLLDRQFVLWSHLNVFRNDAQMMSQESALALESKYSNLLWNYLSTKIIMVRHISSQNHLNDNWSEILPLLPGFQNRDSHWSVQLIQWYSDWLRLTWKPSWVSLKQAAISYFSSRITLKAVAKWWFSRTYFSDF